MSLLLATGTGTGAATIRPLSISSAEAFGSPSLTVNLLPLGIASGETLGTPILSASLSVLGISSQEAFGTPQVTADLALQGILSSEQIGQIAILPEISALAIDSAEAWGSPSLNTDLAVTIDCLAIDSSESFGFPQIILTDVPTTQRTRGKRLSRGKPEEPDSFAESLFRPYTLPSAPPLSAPAYAKTAVSALLLSAIASAQSAKITSPALGSVTLAPSDDGIPDEVLLLAFL